MYLILWPYNFFLVSGIHNGRVLPSDVDRSAADVRGSDGDPEAEQPDGD